MRNSIFKLPLLVIVTLLVCSSCSRKTYLSKASEVGESVYGAEARFQLYGTDKKIKKGELIAADEYSMTLLLEKDDELQITQVQFKDVKNLKLRFADNPNYFLPMLGMGGLSAVFHGFGAVISFPVNLIGGVALNESAKSQVEYNLKEISYTDVKMFARFPQGIPEGMELAEIQRIDTD